MFHGGMTDQRLFFIIWMNKNIGYFLGPKTHFGGVHDVSETLNAFWIRAQPYSQCITKLIYNQFRSGKNPVKIVLLRVRETWQVRRINQWERLSTCPGTPEVRRTCLQWGGALQTFKSQQQSIIYRELGKINKVVRGKKWKATDFNAVSGPYLSLLSIFQSIVHFGGNMN